MLGLTMAAENLLALAKGPFPVRAVRRVVHVRVCPWVEKQMGEMSIGPDEIARCIAFFWSARSSCQNPSASAAATPASVEITTTPCRLRGRPDGWVGSRCE